MPLLRTAHINPDQKIPVYLRPVSFQQHFEADCTPPTNCLCLSQLNAKQRKPLLLKLSINIQNSFQLYSAHLLATLLQNCNALLCCRTVIHYLIHSIAGCSSGCEHRVQWGNQSTKDSVVQPPIFDLIPVLSLLSILQCLRELSGLRSSHLKVACGRHSKMMITGDPCPWLQKPFSRMRHVQTCYIIPLPYNGLERFTRDSSSSIWS